MEQLSIRHLTTAELEAGLDEVRRSPSDHGTIELVVRRPDRGEREVLGEAELDLATGLVGDNWLARGSRSRPDGSAHPEMQVTVMNARAALLVAGGDPERRVLAGDQIYADLDISEANVPAGTRLALGSAVLEVSAEPHTGCDKFVERFGRDAMRFVNSPVGRELRLRGLNAKVVTAGTVRRGDAITKL